MSTKRTSQFWLIFLLISLASILFISPFELSEFEKHTLIGLDVLFFLGSLYLPKSNDPRRKSLIFFIVILPVLYFTIRFHIKSLKEPAYWIILSKSIVQCFLAFYHERLKEVWINRINFYVPFLIILFLNCFFIFGSNANPTWYTSRHATNAIKVFNSLSGRDGLIDAWMFYDFYPSLGYLTSVPFQLILGTNYDSLLFSMLLFWFPLTYWFSLKILKEIFKVDNGYASFLNFAFHSNVMLLSFMKQFMMDYQMVSLLVIQFYFLFRTDRWTNNKYLILNAMICGIGFMIKESYLVYAFLLIGFYTIWMARDQLLKVGIDNWISLYLKAAVAFLCLAFVIVPWFMGWGYLFAFEMRGSGSYETSGQAEGDPYPYSLASFVWYFKAMIYYYTWPVLLILIGGWLSFFRKKEFRNLGLVHISTWIAVWLIFTLLWNKDYRYFMPAIVFFLPAYVGLTYLKEKLAVMSILALTAISLYINFAQAYAKGLEYPFINVRAYGDFYHDIHYINGPLSMAVTCSLMQKRGVNNFEIINKNEGWDNNIFSRDFYFTQLGLTNVNIAQYPDSSLVKKEIFSLNDNTVSGYFNKGDESEYVLLRDSIYICYYFYKFSWGYRDITIEEIGHYGKITGDVELIIKSEGRTDTIPFHHQMKINTKSFTNPSFKFIIYHRHGRWPLIYRQQFTGEIPFKDLSLTPYGMIPLRSGVEKISLF